MDFVDSCYGDLTNKPKQFEEFDYASIEKMKLWVQEKSGLLEIGFFHFADIDKELADKISTTLYIYERTWYKNAPQQNHVEGRLVVVILQTRIKDFGHHTSGGAAAILFYGVDVDGEDVR